MKTSNKILLGSFLTALLILVSVHVALYAKYKRGDYTLVTDSMWPMDITTTHLIKDVKYISLNNIENIEVRASDTSMLRYEKPKENEENILSVTQNGDTLFVLGKSQKNEIGRWYRRTELLLAGEMPVFVTNAALHVRHGERDQPLSLNLKIDKTFLELEGREEGKGNYGLIKIDAVNESRIELRNIKTNNLQIGLNKSSIEDHNLLADSISISTDAASEIKLKGQNLVKAKFTTHE